MSASIRALAPSERKEKQWTRQKRPKWMVMRKEGRWKAVLQNKVLIRRAVDVGVNAKVGDIFLQPARDIFGKRELKER